MKKITLMLLTLIVASISFASPGLTPAHPDPTETPGELCNRSNPDFEEYRYKERVPICARKVSNSTKSAIYAWYGVPKDKRRYYTIDHFIPLSIGGSNDPSNLWPEHKKIKKMRLHLEEDLYIAIRNGEITQQEAIDKIIDAKMHPPIPQSSTELSFLTH